MTDPGFIAGLIGASIALLLDELIKETKKVVFCKEYCRTLEEMLTTFVRPVLTEMQKHEEYNDLVQPWLTELGNCLNEALPVVQQCKSEAISLNIIVRHKLSGKILRAIEKFQTLCKQAPSLNLAVTMSLSSTLMQMLQQLVHDYNQLSLATVTKGCTQSESYSKQRAAFHINNHFAASAIHAVNLPNIDIPSSSSVSDDYVESVEIQPVPQMVFGLDEKFSRLRSALEDSSTPKWIGVWGKGGSGKTLLAQCMNNSAAVQSHFGGHIYFITISRRPNIVSKLNRLCQLLNIGQILSEEDGKTKIFNYLQQRLRKRVLLILDDVWFEDVVKRNVLDWFDLVDELSGSKILVTSRDRQVFEKVASLVLDSSMLSEDDSWKLLCTHAFPGRDTEGLKLELDLRLVETINLVVAECKGLPLALKVIGGSMAGQMLKSEVWNSTLEKLRDAKILNEESEKQLQLRLKISFDELSACDRARGNKDDVLQQCFLYFAAFEEDMEVETETLIAYWIGEGLIAQRAEEDPYVEGYYILGQLIGRSLIEMERSWSDTQNGKFYSCKIHDVLRDLALYIIEHNKVVSERICLFLAGKGLKSLPSEEFRRSKVRLKAQRISLMNNSIEEIPKARIQAPDLALLLLSSNRSLKKISSGFLTNFKNLRVLDLSRTDIQKLPKDIGKLKNLVMLNLNHSGLIHIPKSLGKLTNLKHLNMQNCSKIQTFPVNQISNLVNLQHLNARGCGDLSESVSKTSAALCSGSFPWAGTRGEEDFLSKLGCLKMLRRLWVGSSIRKDLPVSMSNLSSLTLLSLYMSDLQGIPDELKSLASLETLDLNSCMSLVKLPTWLAGSYKGLMTLDLRGCVSLEELPFGLEELKWLVKLDLSGCTKLISLPDGFGSGFPSLEELWLMGCTKLEKFPEVHDGAFSRLSLLNFVDCKLLQTMPVIGARLVTLNMNGCSALKQLPNDEKLKHLVNLEELFLSDTEITHLPASVGLLPQLKKLKLTGCRRLEALPLVHSVNGGSELFKSLEEIYLNGTSITRIPVELASLPRIQKLVVDRSTLSEDVKIILEQRTISIQINP